MLRWIELGNIVAGRPLGGAGSIFTSGSLNRI
jgi:hypothetical protein